MLEVRCQISSISFVRLFFDQNGWLNQVRFKVSWNLHNLENYQLPLIPRGEEEYIHLLIFTLIQMEKWFAKIEFTGRQLWIHRTPEIS